MKITSPATALIVVLIFAVCGLHDLHAQPPGQVTADSDVIASPELPAAPEVTEDAINELSQRLAAATNLSEEAKQAVATNLKTISDSLAKRKQLAQQTVTDQKLIADAEARSKAIRAKLAEKPAQLEELADPSTGLPELVAKLATLEPELQKARDKVRQWDGEAARRSERRSTLTAELTRNPAAITALREQMAAPAATDLSPLETDVRSLKLKAQLEELNAQVPAYKAELSRYDAENAVDFVSLQLQLAQQSEVRLQQQTERLSKTIAEKRRDDARYIADQLLAFSKGEEVESPYQAGANDLTTGPLEILSDLKVAAQTAEYATQNVKVTSDVTKTAEAVTQATKRLEDLRTQVAGMNEKIDRVGLTGAIGIELRKHLKNLPDTRALVAEGRRRQQLMQEKDFERLELSDRLRLTSKQLAKIRGTVDGQASDIELRLLIDQHESLKLLSGSYSEYFNRLSDLDIKEKELIREVDSYQSFIREQVLWIRSHPALSDLSELKTSVTELFRTENWSNVAEQLWADIKSRIWIYVAFTVLVIILLGIQSRFRKNLTAIAKVAGKPGCRTFRISIRALVLTTVLAAAWPSLPAFAAWRLLQVDIDNEFALAVGEGLRAFSAGFFTLNMLRHLCRPSGLGSVHFSWPDSSVRRIRQETHRLMWLLLPLLFCKAMLHALGGSTALVLERLVFIAGLLVMVWYQWSVLHPDRGIFAKWAQKSGGWIFQLRWIAFLILIGMPIVLSIMAAAGFYYTAYEMSWRLNLTIWILITLFVLRSFLLRLFLVQHRQLRMEQAKAKRQALIDGAANQPEQALPPIVEEEFDLKQVSSQTRRLSDSILIIVGILLAAVVWADIHPALSVLDKWTVWHTTVEESVAYVNADDGASKVRIDQKRVPITVADCLISLVVIALTVTATRNLPGFLEITVLQRLPIEPSVRYAIRMMSQYLLVVIGAFIAFANIGVGWDKVQWLAAALTVGLGFGLQEIFANFISGIIILFERPIRISDVVTIGDVSGTVSQIRMRATTITDWDLKEYIVPNKEFITGRLLNWTLSDKVNRVVIEVGVAYGTDTKEARELLVSAAHEVKEVLSEPAPLATFEQFGDSALSLRLRCYLPTLENRLQTITDLHEVIAARFAAAEIEISFPQLDLHVVDIPRGEA